MVTRVFILPCIITFLLTSFTHLPDRLSVSDNVKKSQKDNPKIDESIPQSLYKIKRNILVAKVNGYDIVYDCYNCDPEHAVTDSIVIYAQKGKLRNKLLCETIEDNYLESVTMKYFSAHPFVYIAVSHTHGHFYGKLYAIDAIKLKSKEVKELKGRFKTKIPKNLELWNWNGIRIENGKIFDGGYYKNQEGRNYSIDREYEMIRIGPNDYVLKPIKETIE